MREALDYYVKLLIKFKDVFRHSKYRCDNSHLEILLFAKELVVVEVFADLPSIKKANEPGLSRGVRYPTGGTLKVVWAKF